MGTGVRLTGQYVFLVTILCGGFLHSAMAQSWIVHMARSFRKWKGGSLQKTPTGQEACIKDVLSRARGDGSCSAIPLEKMNVATSEIYNCISLSSEGLAEGSVRNSPALFELMRSGLQGLCQKYLNRIVQDDFENSLKLLDKEASNLRSLTSKLSSGAYQLFKHTTVLKRAKKSIQTDFEGLVRSQKKSAKDVENLKGLVEGELKTVGAVSESSLRIIRNAKEQAGTAVNSLQSGISKVGSSCLPRPPYFSEVSPCLLHATIVAIASNIVKKLSFWRKPTVHQTRIASIPALCDIFISLCLNPGPRLNLIPTIARCSSVSIACLWILFSRQSRKTAMFQYEMGGTRS